MRMIHNKVADQIRRSQFESLMDIKTVAFVGVLSNSMISDKDAALCTWNKPRERETRLTSDHLPVVYKRNLRNWITSRNRITLTV